MGDIVDSADRAQVLVQIEHPEAAAQAGAILAQDGVVGRADLAIAMGERDTASPKVAALVTAIFAAVRDSNKRASWCRARRSDATMRNWERIGISWEMIKAFCAPPPVIYCQPDFEGERL